MLLATNRKTKELKCPQQFGAEQDCVASQAAGLSAWAEQQKSMHHLRLGGAEVDSLHLAMPKCGHEHFLNLTGHSGWHSFAEHNARTEESITNCFRGNIPLSLV